MSHIDHEAARDCANEAVERARVEALVDTLEDVLGHTYGSENDPETVCTFGYKGAQKIRAILNAQEPTDA